LGVTYEPPGSMTVSESEVQAYIGTYELPQNGQITPVEIAWNGEVLTATLPNNPPFTLNPQPDNVFWVSNSQGQMSGFALAFRGDDHGMATEMLTFTTASAQPLVAPRVKEEANTDD